MVAVSERVKTDSATSASGDDTNDKATIARAGLLTMAGSLHAGVFGFALTLLVGSLFGAHASGVFFEAVAIFTILNGIAVLGSDTGLLRSISGKRALNAHDDVRSAIRLTALPVLAWSAVLAASLWLASGPLANALLPEDHDVLQGYLKVLAITLVFSGFGQAALVGSRGFGDLRPYILAYQVGLSTARVAFVALLGLSDSVGSLVIAWALPLVVMDLIVIAYVVRASQSPPPCTDAPAPTSDRAHFAEIWRFNIPRGFASFFETCIVWADVLIVGLFLGPSVAGAYAAASRFVTTGTMAMEAMRVGSAPLIAAAFAEGNKERANEAHQMSSIWLVLLSWPWFLTLAAFSPFVLGLIGDDFVTASGALSVMSLGILAYLLMGNINTVLLMAGKSSITATNTFFTLILNVVLNLILVPTIGLVGAALAWGISLACDSALCLIRGHRHTGVTPPWRGLAAAGGVCVLAYGSTGLFTRLLGSQDAGWLMAHLLIGTAVYAVLLYLFRGPLHLDGLISKVARR